MIPLRGLGWRRQAPDPRDRRYGGAVLAPARRPPNVSLSAYMPPAFDQGQIGSCAANSTSEAIEYCRRRERLPDFVPSRLFIYYYTRLLQGDVEHDTGSDLRTVMKAVQQYGAPPEPEWPYDTARFTQEPPASAQADARADLVGSYAAVDHDVDAVCSCVAQAWPVVFGFDIYESFQSDAVARTGLVPMPARGEKVLGGHSMLVVGYDDPRQLLECRNSWGPGWGDRGAAWLPYAYAASSMAADFWQVDAAG